MKTLFAALLTVVAFFSASAFAVDEDYGWKELSVPNSKLIGMVNRGEMGGEIALICNTETHKLNVTYTGGGKQYDLFVFRKFGVQDMDTPDTAGKFIVGMMSTTQGDIYYNVLNATKAFEVARFPVGSKAIFAKAAAHPDTLKEPVEQEGSEYFLVGNDWKKLLGKLNTHCPFNLNADMPVI